MITKISIVALVIFSLVFFNIAEAQKKAKNDKKENFKTVTIGKQVWMKKNLDVTTYRNGDPIPQVTDGTAWANLKTGAWCYYSNDPAYGNTLGKLYNWYAVNDARGLAPTGWHVPTDAEWTTLTDCLGGEIIAGGKLKETGTSRWNSPNAGATNSSGFSAVPGGCRAFFVAFNTIDYFGFWWSTTVDDTTNTWGRSLLFNSASINSGKGYKGNGCSVRLVRD